MPISCTHARAAGTVGTLAALAESLFGVAPAASAQLSAALPPSLDSASASASAGAADFYVPPAAESAPGYAPDIDLKRTENQCIVDSLVSYGVPGAFGPEPSRALTVDGETLGHHLLPIPVGFLQGQSWIMDRFNGVETSGCHLEG